MGTLTTFDRSDREGWLLARMDGIGASEVPALFNCHPYLSPFALWAAKRGATPRSGESTIPQRVGQALEPLLCDLVHEKAGYDVDYPATIDMWRDDVEPRLFATTDAYVEDAGGARGALELKTRRWSKGQDWEEDPPLDVIMQVQAQLACTGFGYAVVAGLIHGSDLRWYVIERDSQLIRSIRESVADMWRRVESGEAPVADGHEATTEALRAMWLKESAELTVDLDDTFVTLDGRREELKDQRKVIDAELAEIDNRIKAAIGAAETGALPNGVSYRWRVEPRKEHVVAAANPRILRRRAAKEGK